MDKGAVVADTTQLITLAAAGLLDLLSQLYGQVTVPRVVVAEYQAKASPSDPDLQQLAWLTIVDDVVVDPALPRLGPGEAAAISLAKQLSTRFMLLDERKARRIAASHGLAVVGTLAVLVRAKDQGLLAAMKPYLDAMVAQGRYFSEALINQVLQQVGE